MYAILKGKVYHMNGDDDTMQLVVPRSAETQESIPVPYGEEDLTVDPTDTELEAVGFFEPLTASEPCHPQPSMAGKRATA